MGPGADSYALYNGTSMATPHVSGVVALMLSVKPTLTPDQVTSILQSTARAFPATCSQCGSGIVNASAAVTPHIRYPAADTIIALDPDIADEHQRVKFTCHIGENLVRLVTEFAQGSAAA